MTDAAASRRVLLLQGPRSPFFARLADALTARGATVSRVLFCPGDALFWRGRPALRFRGPRAEWPGFLAAALREFGATDVVGLGDGRWAHREGFALARAAGARVHVVEQGWLRPGWLTLEPDALGAWRPHPAIHDPAFHDPAAPVAPPPAPPPPAPRFRASFAAFAAMDVAHHLANFALGPFGYPHHRSHELAHPAREWLGWLGKAARWPRRRAACARALAEIDAAAGPLFLFALQLETDFQIRDHGPAGGLRAALAQTLASFRRAAPPGARLIVKPHPLDPGLTPWRALSGEALFLDGGALEALFPRLRGLVTVNSTAGLSALRAGVPVAALGGAVYEGLAHRGPLDAFWREAAPPDPARVAAFVAQLARDIQTPGAFDGEGMGPGAEGVAEMILRRGEP